MNAERGRDIRGAVEVAPVVPDSKVVLVPPEAYLQVVIPLNKGIQVPRELQSISVAV